MLRAQRPDPDDGAESDGDDAADARDAVVDAAGHGLRLDRFLTGVAPEFSRTFLQTAITTGNVTVEGEAASQPAKRLKAGQRVSVVLRASAESRAYMPEALPIVVVHEDDDVLVVEKAAGMVVHPAAGNWSGTLLNALLARYAPSAALPRAGIVHRLDKDTSGLMVVGRTLVAVTALVRAIAAREVSRRYLAIAHGRPSAGAFRVEAPIGRDPRQRTRMAVETSGKPATTDVECVASDGSYSALRCTLHTGRTHQIRVHLASRGMPLVADRLYGGKPALGIERQALHAAELAFAHPRTGEPMRFVSPLQDDLAPAWRVIVEGSAASAATITTQ